MGIKWKEDYSARTQRVFGLVIGCVVGMLTTAVVLLGLWDWGVVTGAKWWEVLTAFGTVGAVAAAVGLDGYKRYLSRKKRAVMARLSAPRIVTKLAYLEKTLIDRLIIIDSVTARLVANEQAREELRAWVIQAQGVCGQEEIEILAEFEFQAAERVSAAIVLLEHSRLLLSFEYPEKPYPVDYVAEVLLDLSEACNRIGEAVAMVSNWPRWK